MSPVHTRSEAYLHSRMLCRIMTAPDVNKKLFGEDARLFLLFCIVKSGGEQHVSKAGFKLSVLSNVYSVLPYSIRYI